MSIQILLEPTSINDKALNVFSTSLNTIDLNVETVNNQTINYRPPDLGILGDVLSTDGTGGVFWTSNPAPPLSGILYNGTLPATTNRLLKISNPAGTSANESSISESLTELNLTANIPFKTLKTVFTDNQEFITKLYADNIPFIDTTTLNNASGVVNSLISSNVSPNFLLNGLSSSTGITLSSAGNNIEITNNLPSTLINVNNVGTNSLISSNSNPTFNLKGISSSTGITLAPVGNDIEITNNLPSTLININNVGTNSLISSNTNPTFNLKGLSASTGITLAQVGNDIEITNNLPSTLITLNNVGTNSLVASNINPAFTTKGLIAGSNISVSSTSTDLIINNTNPASSITLLNSGSGNSIINSSTNPNFSTKGIIAGSNISLTSTATDITINSTGGGGSFFRGYPFNPFQNATASITTGNKSYFYTVRINRNTTINGFALYVGSGSDPMRVAIYRNFIDSSPIQIATLVGQSASTPASATSMPYTTNTITAVVGQNLNFIEGEYMVIGFGSQGTTNVFYTSPVSVLTGLYDQAFISSSNYVAGGFPATINTATQFSSLLSKICLELH